MKPALWELKRMRYLIVLLSFLFLFIPGMAAGEETPVPNTSIQWKNQLKTLIVADYYPYTFVNKEGVPDGFSVDLVNAVVKVMGMDLEIKVDT
ncbi:MAG: transporter substrate-binding domain-containing protein, partial [Deltaproteobacteria bacterium]|nr:transporter substrate-binding domain-containing protein [Deltaproteobacteria bacterium]